MIAVAVLVAWACLLIATLIDGFDYTGGDVGQADAWRYRLATVSNVAAPNAVFWLAVSLALSLPTADRGLVTVFGAAAVLTTLLGLGQIWNLATGSGAAFSMGNDGARIALMTGGVVLSVTILAIARDRLAADEEPEPEPLVEEIDMAPEGE